MSWPGCGKPALPGPDRAKPALREVVAELAHADRLEDVEAEAILPQPEHLVGEMLARAHAMAQRRHVRLREGGLLQDLPVDGRHADEDRGAVLGDEPRPGLGVVPSLVRDHRLAVEERVHEGGAQHVGPVELARVDDAVAGLPSAPRAPARESRTSRSPPACARRASGARAGRPSGSPSCPRCRRGRRDRRPRVSAAGSHAVILRERRLEIEHLDALAGRDLARAGEEREAQRLPARELRAHRPSTPPCR